MQGSESDPGIGVIGAGYGGGTSSGALGGFTEAA